MCACTYTHTYMHTHTYKMYMHTHTHAHAHTHTHTHTSVLPCLEGASDRFGRGSNVVHESDMDEERSVLERATTAGQVDVPLAWVWG